MGSGSARTGHGSRPKGADGVNASDDLTGGIRRIRLADIGESLGVAEDSQGLLQLGKGLPEPLRLMDESPASAAGAEGGGDADTALPEFLNVEAEDHEEPYVAAAE